MTSTAPFAASSTPQGVRHVPAGEGISLWAVGDTYTIKSTAETSGGSLTFVEGSVPPGSGPPPHVHTREEEAFYILSGRLEMLDGDRTFLAGTGDFVLVPRGTVHRFRNVGVDAARLLLMFTPGGMDGFFTGVGKPARPGEQAPPIDRDELDKSLELAERFGMHVMWEGLPPDLDRVARERPDTA
ncbi:hypothetical protein SUDANB176_02213 [Streptomyces sp. enrichment culture]|uniref:cupin domain-containing protein n=1 Tax=Streptomyces sp. enrichment culture TaxID=1795815 RepID=UPI003F569693